jgi:hypothetical protein
MLTVVGGRMLCVMLRSATRFWPVPPTPLRDLPFKAHPRIPPHADERKACEQHPIATRPPSFTATHASLSPHLLLHSQWLSHSLPPRFRAASRPRHARCAPAHLLTQLESLTTAYFVSCGLLCARLGSQRSVAQLSPRPCRFPAAVQRCCCALQHPLQLQHQACRALFSVLGPRAFCEPVSGPAP